MTALAQDFRYALRQLGRTPAFASVAVVTLALGIGANIAIFSLIDEAWLRPMPVPDSERLLRIFTSNPSSEGVVARGYSSYPDFLDVRQAAKTLSGVAVLERRGAQLDTGSEYKLVRAAVVSDNFFEVLGPIPAPGRAFREAEVRAPGARMVMLSYPFWRQQFNADPALPGGLIVLDRQQVLVTGILPRGFRGTVPGMVPDVWIPMATWTDLTGDREWQQQRGFRDFELFARLRPGATIPQADAELATIAARLARQYPGTNAGRQMSAVPESRSRGEAVARMSLTLLAIAALVLLIACANVASLLLARAESRRHELATRVALGASRLRLVRQLLAETVLIALFAAVAALVLGSYLIEWLPRFLPETGLTARIDAHMGGRVLLFAGLAALASLVVFGLLPAWQASGAAPMQALKQQESRGGAARARMRSGLVVTQVAISLMLTVSGGLLVRSLVNAEGADPGFDAHQNMLVLELVPGFGTRGAGAARAFVQEARRRVEALPGVVGTAAAMRIPFGLSGSGATRRVFLPGAPGAGGTDGIPIHYDPVSDRFFELVGTRLLKGRAIDAHEVETHARVMVVNQTMARRFWPGRDAVGQPVRLDAWDGEAYRVIGVAEDSVNADLAEDPVPYLYTPMADGDYGELTLVVKTLTDPSPAAREVRRLLRDLNPDVPTIYLATLRDHMRLATSDQRMTTRLIASLGALGLFLVAVGLYGLTSFLVGRRTREIGIRLALGAQPRAVFEQVIGRALLLSAVGVVAGAAGAVAATRALRAFLFGVGPADVPAFTMGVAIVVAVTCAAAFVPAWRAAKVDPVTALRSE
jgi:putative ABC transport system permease protein